MAADLEPPLANQAPPTINSTSDDESFFDPWETDENTEHLSSASSAQRISFAAPPPPLFAEKMAHVKYSAYEFHRRFPLLAEPGVRAVSG